MEKAALFTERLPHAEIELPGVGVITVRGLTRYELLLAGKVAGEDALVMERKMLSYAMVDPALTEDEVEKWQRSSPAGEMMPIVAKVNELSGIGKGTDKAAYLDFRDESGE